MESCLLNCQLLNILAASTCLYVSKTLQKIQSGVILSISKKEILTNAFPLNPCNPSITKRLVLKQITLLLSFSHPENILEKCSKYLLSCDNILLSNANLCCLLQRTLDF